MLGVIFFVYGLISLFETVNKRNLADFLASETVTPSPVLLFADVEWSVATPGVYKLKQGSIIQTAMVLAAGFRVMPREIMFAKKINLVSKLTDGKKYIFPKLAITLCQERLNFKLLNGSSKLTASEKQNLTVCPSHMTRNRSKIINSRTFSSVDDLLNNKIVSSKVFDGIKDKITAFYMEAKI